MTQTTHTPGPWVVGTDTTGLEVCTVYGVPTQPTEDGKGQEYVYVHYPRIVDNDFYFPTREENLANARLISAAPDLLAALEDSNAAINAMAAQVDAEWRNHDKAGDRNDKIVRAFREKARAAIAKARGQ